MPDAIVNFTGNATVVVAGSELQQPYIDASRKYADEARDEVARLGALAGVPLARRALKILALGDSHTNGMIEAAVSASGSGSPVGMTQVVGPLDVTWSSTGPDPYFKLDAAINSASTPNASNDQSFTAVGHGAASYVGFLPALLRSAFPYLGEIILANCAAGGSSAYTWAGEQAYCYVRGLANAQDGDTVTLAGRVYTFRAAPAAAYDVQIAANANATVANLQNAVNGEGGGFGAGTVRNVSIWGASPYATDYSRFQAVAAGAAGNALVAACSAPTRIAVLDVALQGGASVSLGLGSDASALYANARSRLNGFTPDAIVITLGTNDANRPGLRGRPMQADLTRFVARLRSDYPSAKIIIHRAPVTGVGPATADALTNTVLPAIDAVVTANPGVMFSADIYTLGAGDGRLALLNTADGIHLTPYGYFVLAQLFARAIAIALGL